MIDYILQFGTQAAAKADAIAAAHVVGGNWLADHVTPITVWRDSQDVAGTDGQGNPTIAHTPLAGFYVLISLPGIVPALRDHAAVQIVFDEAKAKARQTGMVIAKSVSNLILQDIRFQPVFAGRDYPFGGLS